MSLTSTGTIQAPVVKKATTLGWIICILGALFYCYEYLLRIAPGAMVPQLMATFDLDAEKLGAMVSLYYLAYTPTQIIVGVANDVLGPRRILTFAVIACIIGNFLFSISDSVALASIGRFIVGFGSAFAFVSALKLASVWLPAHRFASFAGGITALGMAGGMFGNIALTIFVRDFGWQSTLWIGTISGIILLPFIWFVIRDHNPDAPVQNNSGTHSLLEVLKGLVKLFKNPQLWVIGAVGSVLYLSLSVFAELWGNEFIHSAYGFTKVQASTLTSMVFLGWLVGSPLMGLLSDVLRKRRLPLTIGCLVACLLSALIVFVPSMPAFLIGTILFFFGVFCSSENITFALGRENAPTQLSGTAVAFVNLLVMLGGLIFQPLVGRLLDTYWDGTLIDGVRAYSGHEFRFAMAILPIGLFIGFLLTFALRDKLQEQQQP